MAVLGVTGSLGCGKSTVARMFKKLGAVVFNADRIAHRALYKGSFSYKKTVCVFGKNILNRDHSINRKKLAELVFKSKTKLNSLIRIVYPCVIGRIKEQIRRCRMKNSKKIIVVDAPLLIESGLYRQVDRVVVVFTAREKQWPRVKVSGKLSPAHFKNRLKFQMPQQIKIKYADDVIDNSGTFKHTEKQVKELWKKINKKGGKYERKSK
ncbi:MAG: dephospho-CoA kinase [Candidatus Omnitrophica bacterium]|nr:dephospho-CoA kinase [Candidatus Omnitrophota bacterium]MBU1924519.1 dephospho-CoA kinase [Candidatus Omnitrophota bacterium]